MKLTSVSLCLSLTSLAAARYSGFVYVSNGGNSIRLDMHDDKIPDFRCDNPYDVHNHKPEVTSATWPCHCAGQDCRVYTFPRGNQDVLAFDRYGFTTCVTLNYSGSSQGGSTVSYYFDDDHTRSCS